jgi:hypothetical protein
VRIGILLLPTLLNCAGKVAVDPRPEDAGGGTTPGACPAYGLFGVEGGHEVSIEDGHSVDSFYAKMRADGWPKRLLAIADWGCGMWVCLDCRVEHGKIVTSVEEGFYASEFTLRSFFEAWLEGVDLHAELFEPGEERVGINPFTRKPVVLRSHGEPKGRKWR